MTALGDRYDLTFSDRNWVLSERVTRTKRDTKEEYEDWDIIGYYGNLASVGRRLLDRELEGVDAEDVKALIAAVAIAQDTVVKYVTEAFA